MAGIRNVRRYTITQTFAAVTAAKTLIQIKAGATTPLWIDYIHVSGQANQSVPMDITIVRKTAAATVTSFTPLLLSATAGTGQIAQAAGGTAATGTNATVEGTDGDILWRNDPNAQGGGGCTERFDEGEILVAAAGIIAIKHNLLIASNTLIATVFFSELG